VHDVEFRVLRIVGDLGLGVARLELQDGALLGSS
jgi:hypothetical protein